MGPPEESEEIKSLFAQDVDFFKLRAQLLYCLGAALEIQKATVCIQEVQLEELLRLVEEWENMENLVKQKDYKPYKVIIFLKYDSAPKYSLTFRLHNLHLWNFFYISLL